MPAMLVEAEPQVYVTDMARAREFYTKLLGFTVDDMTALDAEFHARAVPLEQPLTAQT